MGFAVHQRHETRRLKLFLDWVLHSHQLEHGWSHLNRFNCVSNALRGKARAFWRLQDDRDAHGRIVDEETVLSFAVLSKGFAVIAEEDDQVLS